MTITRKGVVAVGMALSIATLLRGQTGATNSMEQSQQAPQLISGALTETFASRYVKGTGSSIGKGPVQQTQADLNLGKYITVTGWDDYDTSRKEVDEIDADLTIHRDQLYKVAIPHLNGNISASESFQYWNYPSKLINKHNDQTLITTLTYTGPITLKVTERHMLTGGLANHGNNFVFDVSEPFKVPSFKDSKLTLGPTFRTAYDDHFFGYNGWNLITPGASLDFTSRKFSVNVFARCELRENIPKAKKGDFWYEGVSVTLRF